MKLSSILVLLAMVSACTGGHKPHTAVYDSSLDNSRVIASAGPGMAYPAASSYRLADYKGTTYITFLKEKLKPALDKLSSVKGGGGGGFKTVGAEAYKKNSSFMDQRVLGKYRGAKWDRASRSYKGGLSDAQVEIAYESLKKVRPASAIDTLTYYSRDDKSWFLKNDMAVALKDANINAAPFDLSTLYALTSGYGVKVKIDDYNYNYHVAYLPGKLNPHVEVMSGRSFASSPVRNVGDATDPEYLRDLKAYFEKTADRKPFYRALILAIANSDASGWPAVSAEGQNILSDFLTVYTAEAVRHLMVNLKDGVHPWEIDLAAVTFVSTISVELKQVVTAGVLVDGDIGKWFAPSPNNVPGGPQRSGIGITRRDRVKFQKVIHAYEMSTPDGKALIGKIQKIIGDKYNSNDVIQGVFEYLSNVYTPKTMGHNAVLLADYMAQFADMIRDDSAHIKTAFNALPAQ